MKTFFSICLLLLAGMFPVSAATDIFIRAKNPQHQMLDYDGDSLNVDFPGRDGWFQLQSVSFGIENTVLIGSGTGGAGAGKARALPLTAIKFPNGASAALFNACAAGMHWEEFEIVFARPGERGSEVTMRAEFKLVMVTAVGVSGNEGDDRSTETLGLQYGAHRITFFTADPKGGIVQAGQSVWSFILNNNQYSVE